MYTKKHNARTKDTLSIYLTLHNLRSAHNVGALLRTADAMNVDHVYFTGYTPYPQQKHDTRLPHIASQATAKITKTSLGAEHSVPSSPCDDIYGLIKQSAKAGIYVAAIEQHPQSVDLVSFQLPETTHSIMILLGNEVHGLEQSVVKEVDSILEITMLGAKESLNVSAVGAITLHWLRFTQKLTK